MTDTVPFYLISSSFGQNELINKRKNSNYIETRQREVPVWKAISGERGMGVSKSLYWGKIDQVQLRGVPLYTHLGQRWGQHLPASAPSLQTRHSPQPSSSSSIIIKPLQDKDCLHCLLLFYYFIFLSGTVIAFLCHLECGHSITRRWKYATDVREIYGTWSFAFRSLFPFSDTGKSILPFFLPSHHPQRNSITLYVLL